MLLQTEADSLIALPKRFASRTPMHIPRGCDIVCDLVENSGPERFILDVWRGTIKLSKVKMQKRVRTVVVLVRLDICGAKHTNPDGVEVSGTHVHVYREGYDDKWASELKPEAFGDAASIRQCFLDFCRFCTIEPVQFSESLE